MADAPSTISTVSKPAEADREAGVNKLFSGYKYEPKKASDLEPKKLEGAPVESVTISEKEFPEGFPMYSKHEYILELVKGREKQPEDSISLFYVSSLQMQQPHSLDRRWTLTKVYEQSSGARERVFSLSGRTGDQPIDIARFFKMRNFIEGYMEKKKKQENAFTNGKNYRLIINFTWEGEKFEASIISFSYQREAGNTTNSYIWNITLATNSYIEVKAVKVDADAIIASQKKRISEMIAVQQAKPGNEEQKDLEGKGAAASKKPKSNLGSYQIPSDGRLGSNRGLAASIGSNTVVGKAADKAFLSKFTSRSASTWYDDISAACFTFNEAFAKASSLMVGLSLRNASIYRLGISPVMSTLKSSAVAAATIAGSVVSVLPNAKSVVITTVADANYTIESLKSAWRDLGMLATSEYWESIFPGITRNSSRGRTFVLIDNTNRTVIAQPAPSGNASGGGTGTQDAYNLAGIFLGDRGRWREIMEVNRMPDPYTREDGSPLQVGDIVLIPDDDGVPATITTDSLFGSDLMVKDGDLVMRGTGGLEIVRGEENLRQSLSHRLRTVRGTNRIFPEFGLASFIGEKQTSSLIAQIWSDIQAQVSADRRIGSVIKILIAEDPMVYTVGISLQMINQAGLSATFEYTPPI